MTVDLGEDVRILRRVPALAGQVAAADGEVFTGAIVDTEAIGLDPKSALIIEIGIVPFEYDANGQLVSVGEPFQSFNDPGIPIPAETTEITGITDEMVRGHSINWDLVSEVFQNTCLTIAHNAAYDRPLLERYCPSFRSSVVGCSRDLIDWRRERIVSRNLDYLLYSAGYFHDGHRAVDDSLALLHLLSRPLPATGKMPIASIRAALKESMVRVWVQNTPYSSRAALKWRGYRWSDGLTPGLQRGNYRYIPLTAYEEECRWASDMVFRRPSILPRDQMDVKDRFSIRWF